MLDKTVQHIPQDIVVTRLGFGGIFVDDVVTNLTTTFTVKKF